MAQGRIYRFPRRNDDGSISGTKTIKEQDGSLTTVDELVFTSEAPTITNNFTAEINNLIESGEINIPSVSQANQHIVDISDKLESGKYEYSFVNSSGSEVKSSSIFRVFLDGINVSKDVSLSEDKKTFIFSDLYPEGHFGLPNTKLIIDFIEEQ